MTIDDLRGPAGLAFARRIAAKMEPYRPPHMDRDDMDGAAALGLAQSLNTYDPDGGASPKTWCGKRVVGAIRDAIRDATGGRVGGARHQAGRPVLLAGCDRGEGTEGVTVADVRQADPADIAAAREMVVRPRGRRELAPDLPSPGEVATRVTELRAAMFAAVTPADIGDVMAGVVERAKAGNLSAARMLIDLLAPGKSGVTVQQQALVIQQGDIG